ncbi:ComF family protein [Thermosipho ferrireducens]|uniref:ComF family protein n=1 Tax=Thermosipho ferrireducens TaxID=2571116 RepID=A0ABX7S5X3_9BACT|nr:phosphoribosyltransferase family protein [Thermosipho ferrireducens]QTA37974.1 ComF family protein [Thermosipho ferrireducens]
MSRIIGNHMVDLIKHFKLDFDLLTYVPVTKTVLFERGFDHMKLISRVVQKELKCDSYKTLKAVKETDQVFAQNREKAVLGKFKLIKNVHDKNILLIDDICTTGNTLKECVKILKLGGANEIKTVVFALKKEGK